MGQSSCIQLLSTKAQVISINAKVSFDKICIQVDPAISYEESSHQITLTNKGLYQVNWWLASHTARHVEQVIFSIGINKNGMISYLHANTANTTSGEVTGNGIIEVKDYELPVSIWLENRSQKICSIFDECGDVYLSDAVVNGSISVIHFSSENSNESQAPLVVAKQVLNEDVTLDYEERIPFTRGSTEIIPEDKGITVNEYGELTVTKGMYLAIWNVNIIPRWSWVNSETGYNTYKVSLLSNGLVKKKIATTGIKAEVYSDDHRELTGMLSGSTVFRIEDDSAKILLENSSWMNKRDSFTLEVFDKGLELEIKNAYVEGSDSNELAAASASSLTVIKIS